MNSTQFLSDTNSASNYSTKNRTKMSMSHFLFPPALFAHGFCQVGIGGDLGQSQEDLVLSNRDKQHHHHRQGKSFTIDSLLGLSNAAARAVLQSGISHHHHHHQSAAINLANSLRGSGSDCWKFDNEYEQYSGISSEKATNSTDSVAVSGNSLRFHPYNNNTNGNSSSHLQSQHSRGQPISNSSMTTARPMKASSLTSKRNPGTGNNVLGTVTDKSSVDTNAQLVRRATKTKRVRTIFTPEQLERLEAEFERQQYMVKVWFQNRRIKWRKQHFEMQQQRLAVLRSQQTDIEDEDSSSSCDFGSSAESMSPTVDSSVFEPEINSDHSDRQIRQHKDIRRMK